MPGARCTRSLVCSVVVAHECSHHGHTGKHPGLVCHRRLRIKVLSAPGRADLPPLDLTPASRRQDHTTSPSALAPFVRMPFDRSQVKPALPSRHMPDAAASTASRSASVTIAIRPSVGISINADNHKFV